MDPTRGLIAIWAPGNSSIMEMRTAEFSYAGVSWISTLYTILVLRWLQEMWDGIEVAIRNLKPLKSIFSKLEDKDDLFLL
ncbi:hypothetical protein WA026_008187 [Henosepilachna vigintioctopunctata]|uniref:Uncharacterized protein n=1 Tax=Henosepilachna vigintioctopunctata TaxID=420089 RepID=A0AAW1TKL5_9CUCU